MKLGVPVICAEVAVIVAVKVIVCTPEVSKPRLSNLETPLVEVVVLVVPIRAPEPEAFVAVTV